MNNEAEKYLVNKCNKFFEENNKLKRENKQLKKKYENAVCDYEQEHYKVVKAIENINKWNKNHKEQYGYNSIHCDELLKILGDKE